MPADDMIDMIQFIARLDVTNHMIVGFGGGALIVGGVVMILRTLALLCQPPQPVPPERPEWDKERRLDFRAERLRYLRRRAEMNRRS